MVSAWSLNIDRATFVLAMCKRNDSRPELLVSSQKRDERRLCFLVKGSRPRQPDRHVVVILAFAL